MKSSSAGFSLASLKAVVVKEEVRSGAVEMLDTWGEIKSQSCGVESKDKFDLLFLDLK